MKQEIEKRRPDQKQSKKIYDTIQVVCFHIPYQLESPSESGLRLLEQYHILSDMNDKLYHQNCFTYALTQTNVLADKIEI